MKPETRDVRPKNRKNDISPFFFTAFQQLTQLATVSNILAQATPRYPKNACHLEVDELKLGVPPQTYDAVQVVDTIVSKRKALEVRASI